MQSEKIPQQNGMDVKTFGTLNLPVNDFFIDAFITYNVAFNYGIYGGRNGLLLILKTEAMLERDGYQPQNELYLENAPLSTSALLNAYEEYDFELSKGESLLDVVFKTFDFLEREKAISSAIFDSNIDLTGENLQVISRNLASPYYENTGMFEEAVARNLWRDAKQTGILDVTKTDFINAVKETLLANSDAWLFGREKDTSTKILALLSDKPQHIVLQNLCILACGGKMRKELLAV